MAFKRKKTSGTTQQFATKINDKVIASDFSDASKEKGRRNEDIKSGQ